MVGAFPETIKIKNGGIVHEISDGGINVSIPDYDHLQIKMGS